MSTARQLDAIAERAQVVDPDNVKERVVRRAFTSLATLLLAVAAQFFARMGVPVKPGISGNTARHERSS
ncbi:hypothetical protein [Streptosporangium roseum]|uniref:hypothetical protein n=1 Tax=Streptosporangium roseum TaxID=2001 RepID=UPI0012DC7B01|nr:hypothetical protein [Streptosporangium roseum]